MVFPTACQLYRISRKEYVKDPPGKSGFLREFAGILYRSGLRAAVFPAGFPSVRGLLNKFYAISSHRASYSRYGLITLYKISTHENAPFPQRPPPLHPDYSLYEK